MKSDLVFPDAFSLQGMRVLVSGSGQGLGRAIALAMAHAGAFVVCADGDGDQAQSTANSIWKTESDCIACSMDTQDEDDVAGTFGRHGPIDCTVLAETMQGGCPIPDMGLDQFDAMQAVNLRGAFILARGALRAMRRRGGSLIGISTVGARHPVLQGNLAYGAGKSGLLQMMRSIAHDHAGDGIRANAILPGAFATDAQRMSGAAPMDGPGRRAERWPLGAGNPQDVGWMAVYLASPAARYVTGQAMVIDGGFEIS